MAIEKRNTARFSERVFTGARVSWQTTLETLKALVNIEEDDGARDTSVKTAGWFTRRVIYFVADHGINLLQVAVAAAVLALDNPFAVLFGVLWVFDFVAAGSFTIFHKITGKDLTVGEDIRRAADTLRKRSRFLGFMASAWSTILAITWTGPEQVVSYYRQELGTKVRLVGALLGLTGIQSLVWALLYFYAFEFVVQYL